jgi:ATP synthase assembly factor FMC1
MSAIPATVRSIYRAFLRELPARGLAARSPLQQRIRTHLAEDANASIEHAEQYLQYIKAQRMYATLLERYNPGMSMTEEDKVRLTARRVGMDLPEEFVGSPKDS